MKTHRFIRKNFDLAGKEIQIEDRRLIHQIKNVLRMKPGDELILCDGDLSEVRAHIKNIGDMGIELKVQDKYKNTKEPNKNITLYCSILKSKNFDLVVEKATEIGISTIVPILSERTVKKGLKKNRLKKKIREAAEQSGRGVVPVLKEKIKLKQSIDEISRGIVFDERGKNVSEIDFGTGNFSIFIGPEGGWTKEEKQLFKENDFNIVKLSDLTFRAETAAIIGSFEALK